MKPRAPENTDCDAKRCEVCGCTSRVINSRPRKRSYWRVLECLRCGHQWDTFESRMDPDDLPPKIARIIGLDSVKI